MKQKENKKKLLKIYRQFTDYKRTIKNPIDFGEFLENLGEDYTGLVFYEERKDTIGKSGGNPTWGYVYEYDGKEEDEIKRVKGIKEAIFKEVDFDYPNDAFGEKLYSMIAKLCVDKCRIPDIDMVQEKQYGDAMTISYCVYDQSCEEMHEIRDYLYNIYQRDDIRQSKSIFGLKDILDCIKNSKDSQIDEESYKEIEEGIVQILTLDSIINNPDRHPNNWSIIRNIKTGKYELAAYDNSRSFYSIIQKRRNDIWASSYVLTKDRKPNGMGDMGDEVLEYLLKEYPEYTDRFLLRFMNCLPEFYEQIDQEFDGMDEFKKNLKLKMKEVKKIYEKVRGSKDGSRDER